MAESKSQTHPAFQGQAPPESQGAAQAEPERKTTPQRKTPAKSKATGGRKAKPDARTKAAAKRKSKPAAQKKSAAKTKSAKAAASGGGKAAAEAPATAIPAPEVDDRPISLEWGRQKLDAELQRTREELEHLRAAMYSEVDIDPEEGDVEVSERLKNVTLIAMLEKRETALQEALSSVLEGSYGICNRCRKPIGQGRLEARPDAKFCVRCQEEIERAARRLA